MRVFRPWIVASVAGTTLGILLLSLTSESQIEQSSYIEAAPRAAVYDPRAETSLSADPFAPAASLAAPPDAPAPSAAAVDPLLQSATPEALNTP